jgi:hypothetical protein
MQFLGNALPNEISFSGGNEKRKNGDPLARIAVL